MNQTIFAVATGANRAALAIVRISGPQASSAVELLCGRELRPRRAELVRFRDPTKQLELDEGLALWFPGPHSFTGEDTLELHLHGGRAVVNAVLSVLGEISQFRLARPGEFTRRAFVNEKLGLDCAEGIADLIEADTELQRRQAMRQFVGGSVNPAISWREQIVELRALIEAHLDFSDQDDVPEESAADLLSRLHLLKDEFASALLNTNRVERLREGFAVVLAGPPNAGKSTLMNALVRRDVALISDRPGTTRDVIEVQMDLGGFPVVLMDTAGLRQTDDPVEAAGIERTLDRAKRADLVVWLDPVGEPRQELDPDFEDKAIRVSSKIDRHSAKIGHLGICALTGEGITELLELIQNCAENSMRPSESAAVLQARQVEFVKLAAGSVESAIYNLGCDAL
ncbi:MAG: hypothetical protein JWN93_2075, partial [Hyphomicrobiales bacterium]|nr:hypothetical protein [Hyphomicrobiales bacterium]